MPTAVALAVDAEATHALLTCLGVVLTSVSIGVKADAVRTDRSISVVAVAIGAAWGTDVIVGADVVNAGAGLTFWVTRARPTSLHETDVVGTGCSGNAIDLPITGLQGSTGSTTGPSTVHISFVTVEDAIEAVARWVRTRISTCIWARWDGSNALWVEHVSGTTSIVTGFCFYTWAAPTRSSSPLSNLGRSTQRELCPCICSRRPSETIPTSIYCRPTSTCLQHLISGDLLDNQH